MRTIEIKLYTFEELLPEARQKALERMSDINTDHDWWRYTYDDADDAGLIIKDFHIDGRTIRMEFYEDAEATAILILANHGWDTDTYKCTRDFIEAYLECRDDDTGRPVARDEYMSELCRCYLKRLEKEYEYLTSDAAVIEAIENGDWEFTKDGKLY